MVHLPHLQHRSSEIELCAWYDAISMQTVYWQRELQPPSWVDMRLLLRKWLLWHNKLTCDKIFRWSVLPFLITRHFNSEQMEQFGTNVAPHIPWDRLRAEPTWRILLKKYFILSSEESRVKFSPRSIYRSRSIQRLKSPKISDMYCYPLESLHWHLRPQRASWVDLENSVEFLCFFEY